MPRKLMSLNCLSQLSWMVAYGQQEQVNDRITTYSSPTPQQTMQDLARIIFSIKRKLVKSNPQKLPIKNTKVKKSEKQHA